MKLVTLSKINTANTEALQLETGIAFEHNSF